MLRINRIEDEDEHTLIANGLRRCPSVANFFELAEIELERLEREAGITNND